jgi:YtkA-like
MQIPVAGKTPPSGTHSYAPRQTRIAHGVILGSGLLVLALLAWVHLGLGALLFPPAPGPVSQVATAGSFQVMLRTESGEMLVSHNSTISLQVTDAAHRTVANAMVTVDADMDTMQMPVPRVTATWANGRYVAHPVFSMAGPWHVIATIQVPGQPPAHATFAVGVRWHA